MKTFMEISFRYSLFFTGVSILSLTINCSNVHAQNLRITQLTEFQVTCQHQEGAADWLHDFPAVSSSGHEVAILTEPDAETTKVSLRFLRISDSSLQVENEYPLFRSERVDWEKCAEEIESGVQELESGIHEVIAEVNNYLEENAFVSMHLLYATYGDLNMIGIEDLPSSPDEIISWGRYHLLVDYQRGILSVSEAIGDDESSALATTEYRIGKTYFQQYFPKKEPSEEVETQGTCVGTPVPAGVWTNPDWEVIGNAVFLLRIGYIPSGDCKFPDEWFVKVVEP